MRWGIGGSCDAGTRIDLVGVRGETVRDVFIMGWRGGGIEMVVWGEGLGTGSGDRVMGRRGRDNSTRGRTDEFHSGIGSFSKESGLFTSLIFERENATLDRYYFSRIICPSKA